MKKKLMIIFAVSICLGMTAACQGAGETESIRQTPAKEKGVVLKIALWGSSGEEKALKEAARGLEEAVAGIDSIVWEQYPSVEEFYDTLPTEAAIGKIPDIVILNNEEHKSLIEAGLLEVFEEYPDPDLYIGNVQEEWIYQGKVYGIPISAAPALFIVNADIWEVSGLSSYPETWEEVYAASKKLKAQGFMPLCIDIGNLYHVTQYLLSYGGGWNEGVDMDSKQNRKAISYILRMFDEELAVTALEEGKSWDGEVFNSKECVMSTGGTWYIGALKETPDIHYKMLPMPHTEKSDKKTMHSYGVSVMSAAVNKEIAQKAAAYLAREEAQKIRMEITGDCPSLISLQEAYYELYPDLAFMEEDLASAEGFGYPADLMLLNKVQEKLKLRVYGKEPDLKAKDILSVK